MPRLPRFPGAAVTPALLCLTLVLLLGLPANPGRALDIDEDAAIDESGRIDLFGLVMNQTRSVPGNEFYRLFSSYWTGPEVRDEYNIFVSDKVHPHLGTWAIVHVNDMIAYRTRLNTRSWEIDAVARTAVGVVQRYVISRFSDRPYQQLYEDLVGDGL